MKPTWLIEANVDGLPSEALQAAVRRHGMPVHVVKPFLHAKFPRDVLGAEAIPIHACTIFTGTLSLMRYIQRHRRWLPGGWCNFENLACSCYYSFFGPFLLNRNYAMLPIIEAIRLKKQIFSHYSRAGSVFVRPDSVDKSFGGKVVVADSFESFLLQNSTDPTMMVLVAEPQDISHEWRLFVAHSDVVTGSQYRLNGETAVAPGLPKDVTEFAGKVLAQVQWRPDPLFVMDVCESMDGFRVVELNSFSCSGHCASDLDAYVSVASRFAALQS